MSDTSFSLEINERYTRIADAKQNGKKVELLSLGSIDTTPQYFEAENDAVVEKQAGIIAQLVDNLKIKKKNVRVILPDGYTYSQIVEMPKLKEKELLAAIRYQADEFIPMPIDETSIDLEILKEDVKAKKVLILIVASPKKIVNQIEKTLEAANLVPESLENELSATGRLISTLFTPSPGTSLYINFGYSHSSIYLVDSATSLIIMSRTLKVGLDLFVRDIKANLNLEEPKIYEALKTIGLNKDGSYNLETIISPIMKELLQEVERIINLARDRYNSKVDKIYIMNFCTHVAMLNTRIESFFTLPVQVLDLKDNLVTNPITQSFAAEIPSYVSVIAGNLR